MIFLLIGVLGDVLNIMGMMFRFECIGGVIMVMLLGSCELLSIILLLKFVWFVVINVVKWLFCGMKIFWWYCEYWVMWGMFKLSCGLVGWNLSW